MSAGKSCPSPSDQPIMWLCERWTFDIQTAAENEAHGFIRVPGNLGLTVRIELLLQLNTFCHQTSRRQQPPPSPSDRLMGGPRHQHGHFSSTAHYSYTRAADSKSAACCQGLELTVPFQSDAHARMAFRKLCRSAFSQWSERLGLSNSALSCARNWRKVSRSCTS